MIMITWKEIEPIFDSISLLLIFSIYSLLEGWREALYFHVKSTASAYFVKDYKEHKFFALQRSCFMGILPIYFVPTVNIHTTIMYLVAVASQMLMFSFLHNGMYYTGRNILNHTTYPKRWIDQTTTSTAKMNFNFCTRTIMFLVGIIAYTIFNIFNLYL